ncbi:Carbohydrate sulfotransferase 1 [Mactra antiquata]
MKIIMFFVKQIKRIRIRICVLIMICLILSYVLEIGLNVFCSSMFTTIVAAFRAADQTHLDPSNHFNENKKTNYETKASVMNTTTLPEYPTKFVLINTYMRSGSTIVGSLLGHHDKAFYFYEPLLKMQVFRYINGSKLCEYTRPVCRDGNGVRETSLRYISDIFNCKLRKHINKYNPTIHFNGGQLGPKWEAFQDCKSKKQSTDKCLGVMDKVCENASYRVIKSLRLSMMDTAYLLEKFPNLYVFQLVRDPRSILNSHIFTSWYPVELQNIPSITADVKTQCRRLRDDIRAGKMLTERYPKRVRIIQYEDIAIDVWIIKTLYQLIGVDKLLSMDDYVNKTMNRRFDSSKVIKQEPRFPRYFGYRDSLPFQIVKITQEHCDDVIQQLGFNIFQTEEQLRNPNISSILSRLPFEL